MWLSNRHGPQLRFLENQSEDTRWISLKLHGDGSRINKDAIGTVVTIWIDDQGKEVPLKRWVEAGASFLSQSSLTLNAGLGQASIKRLEVRWPDGTQQSLPAPEPNYHYHLHYGEKKLRAWTRPQPANFVNNPPLTEPKQTQKAATRFVAGAPFPPVNLGQADSTHYPLATGKPTLIKFWAGWCAPCIQEIAKISKNRAALKQAGITPLLINIEDAAQRNPTVTNKKTLALVSQFANATASQADLDLIQHMLDSLYVLKQKITLPMSVLIDGSGRVIAIYFGSVELDVVIEDSKLEHAPPMERYQRALPFPGQNFDPKIRTNLDRVARKFDSLGHYQYASKVYATAAPFHQHNATFILDHAICLQRSAQHPQAVELLTQALKLDTDNDLTAKLLTSLGNSFMLTKNFDKAKANYLQAKQHADNPITFYQLGLVEAELGNLASSELYLRKAISHSYGQQPIYQQPWHALLQLLKHQGKTQQTTELKQLGSQLGISW